MTSIEVRSSAGPYRVRVGPGLLASLGEALRSVGLQGGVALLSDSNVAPLWGDAAARSLRDAGFAVTSAVVAAGEASKTLETASGLYARLIDASITRSDTLVALGGGVVGDLGGFVAATYHRGMALVHAPTSLLAQVDASIGGKVAVDHPRGKNLIGCFYPPRLVIADTRAIATLPERERWCGLAEVVKTALVADETLLASLEGDIERLGRGEASEERWAAVIGWTARLKVNVVSLDERETGPRLLLNFGHTLGHALEQATGFEPLRHGEAIVIGMRAALGIAEALGHLSPDRAARARALLARFPPPPPMTRPTLDAVLAAVQRDKKAEGGRPRFILLSRPGAGLVEPGVPPSLLRVAAERAIADLPLP